MQSLPLVPDGTPSHFTVESNEGDPVLIDDLQSVSLSPLTPSPEKFGDTSDLVHLQMEVTDLTVRVEQCMEKVGMLCERQTRILASQALLFKRLTLVETAVGALSKDHPSKHFSHATFRSDSPSTPQQYTYTDSDNQACSDSALPCTVLQQTEQSVTVRSSSLLAPVTTLGGSQPQPLPSPSSPKSPVPLSCSDESPRPLPYQVTSAKAHVLPASAIDSAKLIPVNVVLATYPKLQCESKMSTLAVKLATHAIFGESVMSQCTVAGVRDHYPALPTAQLNELKSVVFRLCPRYWKSPPEFEAVWKGCVESIGQACKRLRNKKTF